MSFFGGGRGGRVPDVGVNCLSHSEHKNIRVRYSGTLVEVGGQQVKVQYEKVFISTYTNLDSWIYQECSLTVVEFVLYRGGPLYRTTTLLLLRTTALLCGHRQQHQLKKKAAFLPPSHSLPLDGKRAKGCGKELGGKSSRTGNRTTVVPWCLLVWEKKLYRVGHRNWKDTKFCLNYTRTFDYIVASLQLWIVSYTGTV